MTGPHVLSLNPSCRVLAMRRAPGRGWQGRKTAGDTVAPSAVSQASLARGKPEVGACLFPLLTQLGGQVGVFMEGTPDAGWLTQVRRELLSHSSSLSGSTVRSGTLPRQGPVVNPRGEPFSRPQAHCVSGSRGAGPLLPIGLATRSTPASDVVHRGLMGTPTFRDLPQYHTVVTLAGRATAQCLTHPGVQKTPLVALKVRPSLWDMVTPEPPEGSGRGQSPARTTVLLNFPSCPFLLPSLPFS